MLAIVPSLTIQPLLENAIHHGIEPLDGGGPVVVSGKLNGDDGEVTVTNPVSDVTGRGVIFGLVIGWRSGIYASD
jgi:two-component system sensor histidine kinase AlgZ